MDSPSGPTTMAPPGSLNLNNEVVKMRKEVKRIRVLVIRKLVRSVARLKSKKGTEDALLKNQRRAQRLLEEIHAMKELKPDMVTKSALGDDIDFEKICKKPDSTASERAVARLAVHPLLKKKIDVLKAAVQAFKDARQNATKVDSSKNTSEENHYKDTLCSNDDARKLQPKETITSEQKVKEAKIQAKKPTNNSKEKIAKVEHGSKAVNITESLSKRLGEDSVVLCQPEHTPAETKMKTLNQTKIMKVPDSSVDGNSDIEEELHEEEKVYFDDSTEERFYKQSSMSEDSDSGDDFFIGKARRTRRKESSCHSSAKEQKPLQFLPKEETHETHLNVRNDKNKPSTEARKLESVFFHSLSESKSSRRDYREQAPKSKTTPDFLENKPQTENLFKKNVPKGPTNTKQQLHLPLHPSWEASRRRKEQQSKIAVFQGKKITFDD
ncbi:serum response factor binding protein 1, transcript variant X2 [Ictidomys tridecemlineatus]|uniref:Serum response factor-binding protein 1 n=1 Tax=Ictidomys tridecemlineatus TaxID=43179 RepID=I3NEF3_ICTTR|nr:serum response factor-binding protein 1 isoform X1 [Ictidomys tridecemlineatus]KAG3265888.1 serum response factor binding protein 1, transcript variant X2 [Ictidomys tridecemlineatus]